MIITTNFIKSNDENVRDKDVERKCIEEQITTRNRSVNRSLKKSIEEKIEFRSFSLKFFNRQEKNVEKRMF